MRSVQGKSSGRDLGRVGSQGLLDLSASVADSTDDLLQIG